MTIEGKEEEFHIKDTENNFNEIIKENIPNLGKELQAHTQKGRTRKKYYAYNTNYKDKKQLLKDAREKISTHQ